MARTSSRRTVPKLTEEDYAALGAFRHALRKFMAFSEASARAHGLTAQQHQALLAIRTHAGEEPMSIGELAECLLIKNHSAVGLVGRLQDRGLVVRRISAGDRRRVLLEITPEAERMLATISRSNLAELKSNAEAFRNLLESLRDIDERAAG
jgi:DNA-binding MarR family transcriptional regulator